MAGTPHPTYGRRKRRNQRQGECADPIHKALLVVQDRQLLLRLWQRYSSLHEPYPQVRYIESAATPFRAVR